AEAIRVIQTLKRRLPARAERAVAERMIGISLELYRSTVARFGDDTETRRAFAAGGGVIRRYARHGLIGRHEIRDQLPRGLIARGDRERCARCAEDLEELAPLDASRFRFLGHFSSGSWRSRSAPSCARRSRHSRAMQRKQSSPAATHTPLLPILPSGYIR